MSTKTELTTPSRPGLSTLLKNKIGKVYTSRITHFSSRSKSSPALLATIDSIKPHTNNRQRLPTCDTILDLQVLKGEELVQSVGRLIEMLFGEDGQLYMKRMSGALTNAVYFVSIGENKKMLLRIYGIGCEQVIDREKELDWLSRLSQLHIGPKLLGIFGNGRFEEYLPSTTLTSQDIRQPEISKEIAFRLNQLHSIVNDYPPEHHEPLEVWTMIDKWYTSLLTESLVVVKEKHSHLKEEIEKHFDLVQLHKEINLCKSKLSKTSGPIVFAHNDTQYGNILKVNGTNELVVIDFEYAGYNPRGYDIANHFCEWMYDYHGEFPADMNPDKYPTKEEQLRFLKSYSKNNNNDELLVEVEQWKVASHLFWSLWGLVQASQSEIDFDYLSYSIQRMIAFRKELKKLLSN